MSFVQERCLEKQSLNAVRIRS